ncbi:hypothetical protein AVEN_175140-1 [Araneus ventricosus]|uniref:Uncharacterized protein n=1 Tax=Araneus ventricosus TaxID=182803 RepID=A0A4Y2ILX5_ARAVE|nr:hypothetical protein AVEN_173362-1 [Araneus ventricosus]GBM80644.1 hypothetical protein AVEN_175140-1 [Araneus ventricosus]
MASPTITKRPGVDGCRRDKKKKGEDETARHELHADFSNLIFNSLRDHKQHSTCRQTNPFQSVFLPVSRWHTKYSRECSTHTHRERKKKQK